MEFFGNDINFTPETYDLNFKDEIMALQNYVEIYQLENIDTSQLDYEKTVEVNEMLEERYEKAGIDISVDRTIYSELDYGQKDYYETSKDVYGNPEASTKLWELQNGNRCALYAQKFIIEEITGTEIDIENIVDVAKAYGWFTEEGGTSIENMDKILDYCGIPNSTMYGMTYENLKDGLANGDRIIVAVDADEYWYGKYDSVYTGEAPNHAVEVVGIDETDPEPPMVILNDSGIPNGQGVRIPAETFMEAWEDSNFYGIDVPVESASDVDIATEESYVGAAYRPHYYESKMQDALEHGNKTSYQYYKKLWAESVVDEETKKMK